MRTLVTGGTGYIGRRLVAALVARGHPVRVLVRSESAGRVPDGVACVIGNALDAKSWWPIALLPFYALGETLPWTRASARRLGLVSIGQMVKALVQAVESPPPTGTQRVVEVPEIRRMRLA